MKKFIDIVKLVIMIPLCFLWYMKIPFLIGIGFITAFTVAAILGHPYVLILLYMTVSVPALICLYSLIYDILLISNGIKNTCTYTGISHDRGTIMHVTYTDSSGNLIKNEFGNAFMLRHWKIGRSLTVYYSAKNPMKSCLGVYSIIGVVWWFLVCAAFAGFIIYLTIIAR